MYQIKAMEKKLFLIRIVFREKKLFFKFTLFYSKCFYYFRTSLIFLIYFTFWISYSNIEQKGSTWVVEGLLNNLQEHFSQSPWFIHIITLALTDKKCLRQNTGNKPGLL